MSTYPNPNAELLQWEYTSAHALVEILALAIAQELPALHWKVTGGRGLVGEVPPGYGRYDDRAEWERWVEALSLVKGTPITVSERQHLKAVRHYRILGGRGAQTTVSVYAQVPAPARAEVSA